MANLTIPNFLRDMNSGLMVVDARGVVQYVNAVGTALLSDARLSSGHTLSESMMDDVRNDEFFRFVLDAVLDKGACHDGVVDYHAPDGSVRSFQMTSSYISREDGMPEGGVGLVFHDVTEREKLSRLRGDISTIFILLMGMVCGVLFMLQFLKYIGRRPTPQLFALLVEIVGGIAAAVLLKRSVLTIDDVGLKCKDVKGTLKPCLIITAIGAALLIVVKLLLMKFVPGYFPADAPFWDVRMATWATVLYPVTAIAQEFLTRGVVYEIVRRVIVGKHATATSLVVSSLIFGALHLEYGFIFMVCSAVLLGGLGMLYNKQHNIWGVAIIHYVLGTMVTFMRLAY